jgi:uncharacterized FlaG/YvyC family protein
MSDNSVSMPNVDVAKLAGADASTLRPVEPKKVPEEDQSAPSYKVRIQPEVDPIEEISRLEKIEDHGLKIATETFSIDQIREKVRELEKALPKTSNSLMFSVDEVLNRPVITVVDKKSGEVVRTLPSDEVLRVVHNIDKMKGILFEDDI